MMSSSGLRRGLVAVAAVLTASAALAGPSKGPGQWKAFRDSTVQDFGHQWSTVGDPHNDAFTYQPPFQPPRSIGRTNYKYRVMTREVSVREWFGFVQAYAPYVAPGTAQSPGLIGPNGYIQFHGYSNGLPVYSMQEQFADQPMQANWRHAARFANWLHNNQADAAWAFESGAYDTSTFGSAPVPGGGSVITDQQERSEGARFFLANIDEWSKAGHWDPNRYGDGEGGWWLYPNTSDTAPVSGAPNQGGETNGGPFPPGQTRPLDVGSYPDVQSPWGLLDLSGGAHEWMEDVNSELTPDSRLISGSSIYHTGFLPSDWDRIGKFGEVSPSSFAGVRLVSVIPSPGAGLGYFILWTLQFRNRKRCEEPLCSRSRPPLPSL